MECELGLARAMVSRTIKPQVYRESLRVLFPLYMLWRGWRRGAKFRRDEVDDLIVEVAKQISGPTMVAITRGVKERLYAGPLPLAEFGFMVDGNPHQQLRKPRQFGRALRLIAKLVALIRWDELTDGQGPVDDPLFHKHLREHLGESMPLIDALIDLMDGDSAEMPTMAF